MRLVVFGATGQIGRKVVEVLTGAGHDVIGASRSSGVDVVTGDGLSDAVAGADVLVDVVNSPSFEDEPVLAFFSAASANLVAAARSAGVGHYVALSIVGNDGLPESGYMRAKVAQERTITESGLPYTIVRATQFHEFADMIVGSLTVGDQIRVPDALIQPIAADEVSAFVAQAAQDVPANAVVDLGGPEKMTFADLARTVQTARGGGAEVVVDPSATYFGTPVGETSLITVGNGAATAPTRFADWLHERESRA